MLNDLIWATPTVHYRITNIGNSVRRVYTAHLIVSKSMSYGGQRHERPIIAVHDVLTPQSEFVEMYPWSVEVVLKTHAVPKHTRL